MLVNILKAIVSLHLISNHDISLKWENRLKKTEKKSQKDKSYLGSMEII